MIRNIIQRVDTIISNHEAKAKQFAVSYGSFVHSLIKTQLSKDGVILALLLEQVKLTEAAKALLLLAVVSIVGAFIVKKVFKNYSHIKGLAENFLKSTDVFGAIKEAVSDIADSSCKTDNKKCRHPKGWRHFLLSYCLNIKIPHVECSVLYRYML